MINGQKLYDTAGNVLHAHGGHMIKENGYFYWFGENRIGDIRVSVYRSKDFENWEFCNNALTLDSMSKRHYIRCDNKLRRNLTKKGADEPSLIGCNIERPKVLYNEKTKQYVMWMHYENGVDYSDARCAVAVCDRVDGDYIYLGSFNPIGNMSRDCTVFIDDDKTAYFISAARENADLIIYRLTDDYLAVEEQVKVLWPGQCREAPVLFKRKGKYYMLSSACTGWDPNQGMYAVSDNICGRWSNLKNFSDKTTYDSQPAFVLDMISENGNEEFIYVGDRWSGREYFGSTYMYLPLQFNEDGDLSMAFGEEITIDIEKGRLTLDGKQVF